MLTSILNISSYIHKKDNESDKRIKNNIYDTNHSQNSKMRFKKPKMFEHRLNLFKKSNSYFIIYQASIIHILYILYYIYIYIHTRTRVGPFTVARRLMLMFLRLDDCRVGRWPGIVRCTRFCNIALDFDLPGKRSEVTEGVQGGATSKPKTTTLTTS